MAEQSMRICLDDYTWQVQLDPQGTVVGRSEECDIVIPSKHVSRRHARVFLNAIGQWFVEDMGSSNGTLVNGQRVKSSLISAADVVDIGPASLSFSTLWEQTTLSVDTTPNIIIEDFGTEVFYDKPKLADCDRQPCPERFEEISRCLSKLTDETDLYPTLCQLLAQEPRTAAAIFQVSRADVPVPPTTLACHFGTPPGGTREMSNRCPSPLAFRVSHRLLEVVRKEGRPLMTKSIFSCDTQVTLSIIDEHSPRALICVPLSGTDTSTNLLYVDVPIDERRVGAEEMFAFIQTVAQLVTQVNDSKHRGTGPDNA